MHLLGRDDLPAALAMCCVGAEGSLLCILCNLLVCLAASQLGGGTLDTALNTVKEEESSTSLTTLSEES